MTRKFIFNFFMAILIATVLMFVCWCYVFFTDAFGTLNNVQKVMTLMKKEVIANNGFIPDHMKIDTMLCSDPDSDGINEVWGYTLQDPYVAEDFDYNFNGGLGNTKVTSSSSSESNYIETLYQGMLKDAIAASNVFDDATVSSITCTANTNTVPRGALQFTEVYDADANLVSTTAVNMDIYPTCDAAYIVGQRGDWITVTVTLHTTRSMLMAASLYNTRTEETGITITNIDPEDSGHAIDLQFTVPCLKYLVGRKIQEE